MNEEKPKTRGRPQVSERGTVVSAYVPVKVHDDLIQLAAQRAESVSSVVRQLLVLRLPPPGAKP